MNLDKPEMKLLLAALALTVAKPDEPVRLADLRGVFERPGMLRTVVDKLRIGNVITFDSTQNVLRVLPDRVWQILNQYGVTPELFTDERPLDAALHEVSKRQLAAETRFAPAPRPPEPPPPPKPPVGGRGHVTHVNHAMPSPKPFSPRLQAACAAYAEMTENKLRTAHEVNELAPRTTAEMLEDILTYVPGITPDYFLTWFWRITRESAEMVNASLREYELNRLRVGNPGGFMNALYLRSVRGAETTH